MEKYVIACDRCEKILTDEEQQNNKVDRFRMYDFCDECFKKMKPLIETINKRQKELSEARDNFTEKLDEIRKENII